MLYSPWGCKESDTTEQLSLHFSCKRSFRAYCGKPVVGVGVSSCRSSLVAQRVKNLPAMQETQVHSLDQEDSLEKGKATHSSILA